MTAVSVAAAERRALADSALEQGPDAPTLCGEWSVRDLLAHLIIRERRLDAAPGIVLPPLAAWTGRVQAGVARREFGGLVADVRSGPPAWSPLALAPLAVVQVPEFFMHQEDVRRAQPGWSPRPPSDERDAILWRSCALLGRLSYRRSPVGVTLRRPDGAEHVVKRGERTVVLLGEPGELLLHAAGRSQVVISPQGEPADIAAVEALDRGL